MPLIDNRCNVCMRTLSDRDQDPSICIRLWILQFLSSNQSSQKPSKR